MKTEYGLFIGRNGQWQLFARFEKLSEAQAEMNYQVHTIGVPHMKIMKQDSDQ